MKSCKDLDGKLPLNLLIKYSNPKIMELELAISLESERLAQKYGKSCLTTKEVQVELGLGRDAVLTLMNSPYFPALRLQSKFFVSTLNFARWLLNPCYYTCNDGGGNNGKCKKK